MGKVYELPALLWRLPLGATGKPHAIIAHSFTVYEFLVDMHDGVEALSVDVQRGVLWREPVIDPDSYIGRGLRVREKSIVDTDGNPLLKTGLNPSRKIYGRRLVLLLDERRAKIVDKTLLEEVAEVKAKSLHTAHDEYTFVVLGQAKRSHILAVDSVNGFTVERLRRSPSRLAVSRGCFTACDRLGCLVGNGSFIASTAASNVRPLAGLRGYCLVAFNAESGSVVALVSSDGSIDVIDSCSSEPHVVYSDSDVAAYTCDGRIHLVKPGSPPEDVAEGKDIIITPSFELRVESNGVKAFILEDRENTLVIPVEHYSAIAYDTMLVLSGGWLYSLDLARHTPLEIERDDACPAGIRVVSEGFRVVGLEATGEGVKPAASQSQRICLEPITLRRYYSLEVTVKLAPPLVYTIRLGLEAPKPKLRFYVAKTDADYITLLRGSRVERVDARRVLLVMPAENVAAMLEGAIVELLEGNETIASSVVRDGLAVLPLRLQGRPSIRVRRDEAIFEYTLDYDVEELSIPKPLAFEVIGYRVRGLRRIQARLVGVDADLLIVDDVPCEARSDAWICDIDPYRDQNEVCSCYQHGMLYVCGCVYAQVSSLLRREYALIELKPSPLLEYPIDEHRVEIPLAVKKPGVIAVEARLDEKIVNFKAVHVDRRTSKLSITLNNVNPGLHELQVIVADSKGVRDGVYKLLAYKPLRASIVTLGDHLIVCSKDEILLELDDSTVTIRDSCITLPRKPMKLTAIDECGRITRVDVVQLDIASLLAVAARIGAELAASLGFELHT